MGLAGAGLSFLAYVALDVENLKVLQRFWTPDTTELPTQTFSLPRGSPAMEFRKRGLVPLGVAVVVAAAVFLTATRIRSDGDWSTTDLSALYSCSNGDPGVARAYADGSFEINDVRLTTAARHEPAPRRSTGTSSRRTTTRPRTTARACSSACTTTSCTRCDRSPLFSPETRPPLS